MSMVRTAIDAQALMARLSKAGGALLERETLAPLLPRGLIRTRLDGLVYTFKPRGSFSGWGRFRPLNEREAEPVGEAWPWERGAYLALFPLLRLILLWPDPNSARPFTWWAIPFNESEARQRFGLVNEPLPVFLCDPTDGADRFARVLARVDGRTLWYDGLDLLSDPAHAEWLRDAAAQEEMSDRFLAGLAASERRALLLHNLRSVETAHAAESAVRDVVLRQGRGEQREWLRRRAHAERLEDRLCRALGKADAVLHGYTEIPGRDGLPEALIVEWGAAGQRYRYRSTLDPNLAVVSSGICLSGRDGDFDLTSLVSVMHDA
jgi:hypothetical protein